MELKNPDEFLKKLDEEIIAYAAASKKRRGDAVKKTIKDYNEKRPIKVCRIEGCIRTHAGRGLCAFHWKRALGSKAKARKSPVPDEYFADQETGKEMPRHLLEEPTLVETLEEQMEDPDEMSDEDLAATLHEKNSDDHLYDDPDRTGAQRMILKWRLHPKYEEWVKHIKYLKRQNINQRDLFLDMREKLLAEGFILSFKRFIKWLTYIRVRSPEKIVDINVWEKGRSDPVFFAEEVLGLELHKKQKIFLRNVIRAEGFILCPSNQFGKSFIIAVLHIWACFYRYRIKGWETVTKQNKWFFSIRYQTINLSPVLDQAITVYGYILDILTSNFIFRDHQGRTRANKCVIPDFLISPRALPSKYTISFTPVEFANGTKTMIRSTKHDHAAGIQGKQFGLITYDECALAKDLEREITGRIHSRLITMNGQLILVSTPDRDREEEADSSTYEYFKTLVEQAEQNINGWTVMRGTITDNHFLNQESIEKRRLELERVNPDMAKQIYDGSFINSRNQFFRFKSLQLMFNENYYFEEPRAGRGYVIGADFASGGNGWTCYIVADITDGFDGDPWKIVKFERFRGNAMSPLAQIELLRNLADQYNAADVAFDSSSLGGSVIANYIEDLNTFQNDFRPEAKKELIFALRKWLDWKGEGKFRAPTPDLKNGMQALRRELSAYRERDQNLTKDTVMALGLVAWHMENLYYDGQFTDGDGSFDIMAGEERSNFLFSA